MNEKVVKKADKNVLGQEVFTVESYEMKKDELTGEMRSVMVFEEDVTMEALDATIASAQARKAKLTLEKEANVVSEK